MNPALAISALAVVGILAAFWWGLQIGSARKAKRSNLCSKCKATLQSRKHGRFTSNTSSATVSDSRKLEALPPASPSD